MLPREHYLKQAFQDPIHFPDGFEKGGLSDIQARLVRKNGTLINALSIDEVSDPTTEDLHLLKVIANQSSPKNPVEQAWVKYLSLVKSFAVSNPKGKSKAKASKPLAEIKPSPEPVKDVEKAEKPTKIAEKADTPKTTDKKSPKKVEVAPVETKTKAAPAKNPITTPVKNEKAVPAIKAPAKAAAKKPEPKKEAPKKAEVKKPEPKKAEPKKADVKKAEPKKADAKKVEAKVEAKKTPAKKTKS